VILILFKGQNTKNSVLQGPSFLPVIVNAHKCEVVNSDSIQNSSKGFRAALPCPLLRRRSERALQTRRDADDSNSSGQPVRMFPPGPIFIF
jgi:hypothetical protein